jgi:hypothetical protein
LKQKEDDPSSFLRQGGERSLSGEGLRELLEAVLERKKPFRFQARGFSMSPSINDGDIVTVFPYDRRCPQSGDIVAFLHPETEKLVIHRIVGKKRTSFLLKGDSTFEKDGLVPGSRILGLVKRVERRGRVTSLGSGSLRFLIAFLSRRNLLLPVLSSMRWVVRPFRFKKNR